MEIQEENVFAIELTRFTLLLKTSSPMILVMLISHITIQQ
jgi:hypothetical protein